MAKKLFGLVAEADLSSGDFKEIVIGDNLSLVPEDGNYKIIATSGGSPAWGNIIGTLSAQTDLNNAMSGKSDNGHSHSQLHDNSLDHSNSLDHALHSDDQDLTGKVDKITGKGLSTNDYTTTEQLKLSGIETEANNYTHPANHAPSIITQDASNRFVSDTEKSIWNGKGNSNLVLGDLITNAYYGDKGTVAYDHSQVAHAPSGSASIAVRNIHTASLSEAIVLRFVVIKAVIA